MMMIVFGLPLSRAMMSIGMIVLVVLAILQPDYTEKFRQFIKTPPFIAIIAFYLLVVLSGFWSENKVAYLNSVRIKLPFVLMPLAFYVITPIKEKGFVLVLKTYFWLVVVSCAWSMIHLVVNYNEVVQSYVVGRVLFTPVNHIRFSLMCVMAIVVAAFLLREKHITGKASRIIYGVFMAFIIGYIHILAVRSGMLALYVVSLIIVVQYILQTKRYFALVVLAAAMIITPLLAYQFSETFQTKYRYMKYEVQHYMVGDYTIIGSDIRRMLSIQSGIAVGNENILLGTGYGDVTNETYKKFEVLFPELTDESKKPPHNQYVYTYAGLGLFGLLLFLTSVLLPLFYKKAYRNMLVLGISLIAITSFFTEYMLETQVGVAFYTFFLLLPLCIHLQKPAIKPVSDKIF